MDKSWMDLPRTNILYKDGVMLFLDFAFAYGSMDGLILCPCKNCGNGIWVSREDAKEHLICDDFVKGYTKWVAHGETSQQTKSNPLPSRDPNAYDDIEGLLHHAFGIPNEDDVTDDTFNAREEMSNVEAKRFSSLIDDSQQPLYPGCESFTKLSHLVHLLHIKCMGNMSDITFTRILHLLRKAFPTGVELPKSYYDTKKFIKKMGFCYEKYDACRNDCMLYWGVDKEKERCDNCMEPRWIEPVVSSLPVTSQEKGKIDKKVAAKIVWHFPIKPRLQRLFSSSKIASFMRWHAEGRVQDTKMRHPTDSPAWKTFDFQNVEFAKEPRNVRLGLATDGFNPFKNMSTNHSSWPVVMIPYNLPPELCMKKSFFMLSLLIPGPTEPGKELDVYLQPLIAELKELWDVGLTTFDASVNQTFNMRAALMWTISDLPGYTILSGWGCKGYFACPVCHKYTCSEYLFNSRKNVYLGHRRFLEEGHPYRNDKDFNGQEEHGIPPPKLTGSMILLI